MRTAKIMRPGTLDGLEVLRADETFGTPAAGEIAVRLHASSLNYHDYLVVNGTIPTVEGRIPMSDGAGDVVAVGPGVKGFAVGDMVIGAFFPEWFDGRFQGGGFSTVPGDGADGYARSFVTRAATAFTRAPRGYSHAEAATLPCAAVTAWRALVVEGKLIPGETVLVQGTGGVSIFALQFAKAMGCTVVATSSSAAKRERLLAMGADHVIDYAADERWGGAVKKALGRGVDHVVEVGGAGTFGQSISACAEGGHIAVIGILSGGSANVPTANIMAKQLRVTGITVGSRRHQSEMIAGIDGLKIKPVIDRAFDLADIVEAFRYQESGGHFGKIVLTI